MTKEKYPKGLVYCNVNKALVDEEICSKCEDTCIDEDGTERLK